jgi:hypothetical protein
MKTPDEPKIVKLLQPKTERGNDAADNWDEDGYLARAKPVPITAKTATLECGRFRPKSIAELLSAPRPSWRIKGVLPTEGVGSMLGLSHVGKTFCAIDLAVCVATGQPWFGHKVKPAGVIYVTGEGRLQPRFEALLKAREMDADQLHRLRVVERPVNLLEPSREQLNELIAEVRAVAAGMDVGVGLVVLDTWARMTPGSDEGASATGLAIQACDQLRDELGCFVLSPHHPGHQNQNRARGHSSFYAALDVELLVESPDKRADSVRTITATKVRDGEADRVLGAFQLDVVLLGQDEDGDDITSCVLVPTDAPPRAGKPVKPTNRETFLLRALNEELDSLGSQAPIAGNAELALGAKVWQRMAEEDSVRERFRQLLGSSSNERRDWSAARNGCVGKHLVGSGSGFLWIAEKPY